MKYLSVCSGIEAATVAWHPLGWKPFAFAEIEKFPSAVLAHHYPSVPNLGDMTKFKDWPDADINVLVGGTPCQSFSVAGLRKGMADPRGNLALTYLAIADRYRPEWLVWENVPGVLSSSGGRDFGAFIGGLAELGYHAAWRVLDAQYVRVDGFARAVPQRRRRVFVVGHLGDWRRSAAVLFERESLLGNSAPRRQAGEGASTDVAPSIVSSGRGTERTGDTRGQDPVIAVPGGYSASGDGFWRDGIGPLRAREQDSHENLVAHSLRAEGFDASEDGTGRGTPIVPVVADTITANWSRSKGAKAGNQVGLINPIITFDTTQITSKTNRSNPMPGDACHPLAAGAHPPAVAWAINSHAGAADADVSNRSHESGGPVGLGIQEGAAYSLRAGRTQSVGTPLAVRRLTPNECEGLQGFQRGYTAIPKAADGPRYKALGNSMAVNVMRWLGRRIELTSSLTSPQRN